MLFDKGVCQVFVLSQKIVNLSRLDADMTQLCHTFG